MQKTNYESPSSLSVYHNTGWRITGVHHPIKTLKAHSQFIRI